VPLDALRLVQDLERLLTGVDLGDGDLEGQLERAVVTAAEVFDVDGAGLMLALENRALRLVAASNAPARALEQAQVRLASGPGVDSTRENEVVLVRDLQEDGRWPELAALLAEQDVRAVLSAPVWVRGRPTGNFNLLCKRPRTWSEAEVTGIRAYAGIVTALLRIALEAQHGGGVIERLRAVLEHPSGEGSASGGA
jgi:GAF domain-containing protein